MQVKDIGTTNPWYYFTLGRIAWKVGETEISFEANRTAHSYFGWPESKDRGYKFTHDFFSPNIPAWEKMFDLDIDQDPLRCLEIGSWQGGSSAWLLDKIISKRPGSRLTCIDAFEGSTEHAAYIGKMSIESIFDFNIASTGSAHLCTKLKGYSQDVLLNIREKFDFIYIDGAHEARFVIQDAFLSWRLLDTGGFILFDDYPFEFPDQPEQNTAVAIDQFILWNKKNLEVLHKGRQMLIKRLA